MELVQLENKKERLSLEIKGEGHSFCNALRKELWNDKSIEIAGYRIEHSLVSESIFTVEVNKGSAKDALLDAASRLKKLCKELKTKTATI